MRALRTRSGITIWPWIVGSALALGVSCGSQEGGLVVPDGGAPGTPDAGRDGNPAAGEGNEGTSGSGGTGGSAPGPDAGTSGDPTGGTAGEHSHAQGGTAGTRPQASAGAAGAPDASAGMGGALTMPPTSCVYFTESPPAPIDSEEEPELPQQAGPEAGGASGGAGATDGGAAGAGGSGPEYTITILKSPFVGTYLADSEGKALYLYGADFPGDCEHTPVTNCYNDCAIAWPIFEAGHRVLPPELDDSLFGAIERTDGLIQATYRGWPLYYYKNDVGRGDVLGHARGLWHLAEVDLPNVVILRIGTQRLLANEFGRSLYVFEEDTLGTTARAPESACADDCLENFEPFALRYLSPVSYLEPSNFTIFVRHDGQAQIAYKGAPLYLSRADERSGEMNGAELEGWQVAIP